MLKIARAFSFARNPFQLVHLPCSVSHVHYQIPLCTYSTRAKETSKTIKSSSTKIKPKTTEPEKSTKVNHQQDKNDNSTKNIKQQKTKITTAANNLKTQTQTKRTIKVKSKTKITITSEKAKAIVTTSTKEKLKATKSEDKKKTSTKDKIKLSKVTTKKEDTAKNTTKKPKEKKKREKVTDIVCGLDEAGRGPVLGPLVVAAVSMTRKEAFMLKKQGLTDSKLLSPKHRDRLYELIKASGAVYKIVSHSAAKIDKDRKKMTLNQIEVKMMTAAALHCSQKSPFDMDVKPERLAETIRESFPDTRVTCKHKADYLFPVVSAASILAKVTRDNEMKKLEKKMKVPIGSGYPSDPTTINFLKQYYKKYKKMPQIARNSWDTVRTLINKSQ